MYANNGFVLLHMSAARTMSFMAATVLPARRCATRQAQRSVRLWNGLNAPLGE